MRSRLLAACLLACAFVVIGLAATGILQQMRARAPVAIVAKLTSLILKRASASRSSGEWRDEWLASGNGCVRDRRR